MGGRLGGRAYMEITEKINQRIIETGRQWDQRFKEMETRQRRAALEYMRIPGDRAIEYNRNSGTPK